MFKYNFREYKQPFIAFVPFVNLWYFKERNVFCIGWLKWSFQLFMEKDNGKKN